eukprot:3437927-Alexandrium_andersonii.AAC.1
MTLRECTSASGVRSSSCALPATISTLVPEDVEGCILLGVSRRSRMCQRNRPVGVPETLLGVVWGSSAEPPRED